MRLVVVCGQVLQVPVFVGEVDPVPGMREAFEFQNGSVSLAQGMGPGEVKVDDHAGKGFTEKSQLGGVFEEARDAATASPCNSRG